MEQPVALITGGAKGIGRAIALDLGANVIDQILEAGTPPFPPARAQIVSNPLETVAPMGIEDARDHRRVMGPVFEQHPVALVHRPQMTLSIGLVAREENLVMRPLDRIDAVDLHEAEPLDQAEQAGPVQPGAGRRAQPLQMQEQPAGLAVGNQEGHALVIVHRAPDLATMKRARKRPHAGIRGLPSDFDPDISGRETQAVMSFLEVGYYHRRCSQARYREAHFTFRVLTLLLAMFAITACPHPINRKNSTNYAIAADNAQRAGDWFTARKYWGRAIISAELGRVPPQALAILWYEYGRSSGVICDWAEAEIGLTKALELDKQSNGPTHMSFFELGCMNFDRRRYDEAASYFGHAMRESDERSIDTQDPIGHADLLTEYAISLENIGRGAEARKHRARSAELRATFPNGKTPTDRTPYGTQCEAS